MNNTDQSPVTASAEQATTYAVANENKEINNLKTKESIMETETTNQINAKAPCQSHVNLQDACPIVPLEYCLGGGIPGRDKSRNNRS